MSQSTSNELYPEKVEEKRLQDIRVKKVRNALKDVHITRFTVSELPALCRLLGLINNGAGQLEPTERDLLLLEEKIFSSED